MPEPCESFQPCDGLDGRLIVSTVIQGPPLASDLGEISFGSFTSTGAAARPYIDVQLNQTWTAKEACYGPVRSIFSLAPGETVQIATSVRHDIDFVDLVTRASSNQLTKDVAQPPPSSSVGDVAAKIGAQMAAVQQKRRDAEQMAMVSLATRYVGAYGSLLEVVGDVLAPGVGQVVSAAEGVVSLVNHGAGGDAPAVTGAMAQAKAAVTTVARTQSQASQSESKTTSESTETVQSMTRTFSNPYRDRSLQLRFIPVFRHFEVRTWPRAVVPGIGLHVGPPRASDRVSHVSAGARIHDLLADAATTVDAATLQRPLMSLLAAHANGGPPRITRGTATAAATNLAGALRWSDSSVRDDSVLVPLADAGTAAAALGLEDRDRKKFETAIGRIRPDAVVKLVAAETQQVHLFMGTHIEAVAGQCVLADVPPVPSPDD